MKLRHLLRRFVLMNAFEPEGGGGGAAPETVTTPADTSVVTTPDTITPAEPKAPTTMLEAIEQGIQREFQRDELGRFAPKTPAEEAALAAAAQGKLPLGTPPAAPATTPTAVKPGEEDLVMPANLAPDSQKRFQSLANEVRELRPLREEVDTYKRQIAYVQETFSEHGIKQEQFEQAADVIGMINRRDFAGAERVLMEQLQQIALLTGRQPAQVDALANFPDLRNAVDQLQVTESHAIEIARARQQSLGQQQVQQRQEQAQQVAQQEQQAFKDGQRAVDTFCQQMRKTDVDYSQIEAQLLPHLPKLLNGVPPPQWAGLIQAQYQMIKQVAANARQSAAPASFQAIRPTGAASPATAPQTMHEAMWGTPKPRLM